MPIAVFDSGVGGLTVLKALRDRLSHDYVYFGDTAHVPYGTKSPNVVRRYTKNAAQELQRRFDIEALVIACHTASVHAADTVRRHSAIPVIDMTAGLVEAVRACGAQRTAILGTPSTIASGRHADLLTSTTTVVPRACPLFVPLVEEGWINHPVSRTIAEEYIGDLVGAIDAVVLACTHYPLLRPVLASVLGDNVIIIDPAEIVADILATMTSPLPTTSLRLYTSDNPYRFAELSSAIMGEATSVERLHINHG